MKNFQYKSKAFNYDFTFDGVINLFPGFSATGKTALIKAIDTSPQYVMCKYPVYTNIDILMLNVLPVNSMVFIDLDTVKKVEILDAIATYKRTDVTFVLFGRKNKERLPVAIQNTFELRTIKGVTRNVPICPSTFESLNKFNTIVTEDSRSGNKFFSNVFTNVKTAGGKEQIIHSLSSDNLLIFDGVGFGTNIIEFLKIVKNRSKPYNYICWHSFEHFILENVFHDTRELPIAVNIEDALVKRLQEYNPHYSKNMGCTGDACQGCKLNCYKSSLSVLRNSKYKDILDLFEESSYTKEDIDWCRNMCPDTDKDLPDSDIWSKYGDMCKKYKT